MLSRLAFLGLSVTAVQAYAGESVAEFGSEETRQLTIVGTPKQGLAVPRDLGFNSDDPSQLWVVNRANDSVSIFFNPGTPEQLVDVRKDAFANHFMEEVSSLAFGANTYQNSMTFATCQESRNTYDHRGYPNDFMGPTLWSADLDIFAKVHQDDHLLGSHLDMNHQSPYCMGIAHQAENQYWVFDGLNGHLVYYDFAVDHGPGHDDHADAIVRRYIEVALKRVENVPGHMELDKDSRTLYIADTGNRRILAVNTTSGFRSKKLKAKNEPLAEFSEITGVEWRVLAEGAFVQPSGLALTKDKVFVTDYANGNIIALDRATGQELERISTGTKGIMGITVGPEGKLWFVDGVKNVLVRIDP